MSAARAPTPEQAAAIGAAGRNVLLEAGAGTGKTGVIVERYCRLVCDEDVPLDAILAFTFTEKAAAELRERIRAELSRRAVQGSERARALLGEVGGAWVTTIHAFCNRLLGGHPIAAGIDPRFRVLDAPEAERVAREAFDEALEEFLETGGESRELTLAAFGIDGLRAIVSGTHAELRSRGFAEPVLPDPPPAEPAAAIRRAGEAATAALDEIGAEDPRRGVLERAAAMLDAPEEAALDELGPLVIPSKAKNLSEYCEAIEAAIAKTAEAGEGGEAYRHVAVLIESFSARFEAAKRRRAGVDFEDLQLLAASLLEETEIGDRYRSRFRNVLVDEFQDTNRLQLRLIEALRGPGTELMVVGDECQSIYGFRHADLDVFREQRLSIEEEPGGERMELSGNFRSRPELIGAINALSGALLGETFHPLRVGVAPPPGSPPGAVELLLTASDGWDAESIDLEPTLDDRTPLNCLAEARFVAERLRALADAGVGRSEMVVLLRAFTHLDAYEDSLERAGLRPYVVGGRGYWSQQQVVDVCALLATIANPLDDQALFGALASPACGLAPDTLWLLRAAAGRGRHVWPAVERAAEMSRAELAEPERLAQIPAAEMALLRGFTETITRLRENGFHFPLEALIDAAVTETGYDLAVLMRPDGEARFANVRKLMSLAAEFEAAEGRYLRGFLDFVAARAGGAAEAEAATANEGHDGVRIMTIHNAKGLEFGVVAVPDLSRALLAGSHSSLLVIGRGEEQRVGMQLRCLGAPSVNLYHYDSLCEEEQRRNCGEELRLFHVAATRARRHLILSGVVKAKPGSDKAPGRPVIERIVDAFGIDRERDSKVGIRAPEPRPGLEATFTPSEIAVRVSLPSPERAAELAATKREDAAARSLGVGPPALVERRPAAMPSRPLSYTALASYGACAYRFYLEDVLGLSDPLHAGATASGRGKEGASREEGTARGAAVHALLEWSHANGWREPPEELALRQAVAAGLGTDDSGLARELLEPVRGWLESRLFHQRIADGQARARAEVPILLGIDGTVLRGSLDLLVEGAGAPPLVIDYKTDRLNGSTPHDHAARYEAQRTIYALAVAEASGVPEVDVAYVFLERPDEPVLDRLGSNNLESGRERLVETIQRIAQGEFEPVAPERRDWDLCRGCPALGRMCSGPRAAATEEASAVELR